MWDEMVDRKVVEVNVDGVRIPSHVEGTAKVPQHDLVIKKPVAAHWVQSLRTIPQANFAKYNCWPASKSISYAPKGIFEVRTPWRRALATRISYT